MQILPSNWFQMIMRFLLIYKKLYLPIIHIVINLKFSEIKKFRVIVIIFKLKLFEMQFSKIKLKN